MAGCGLRVSEACDLTFDQVHWSSDHPFLRFPGKGQKVREVTMNLQVQDALRTWLEERGTGGSSYVFCNLHTGGRLHRKTVWWAFRQYGARAAIQKPELHPHRLRHTFGTYLADQGVPIEQIRELMGHISLLTTLKYIEVSKKRKAEATDTLDRRTRFGRWLSRQRNRSYRFLVPPPRRGPAVSRRETVGRRDEIAKLQDNLDKGIDTLLVGAEGVGKRHLLDQLQGDRIIRVAGLKPVKPALIEIAEMLHQRGVFTATLSPSRQPVPGAEPAPESPSPTPTPRARDFDTLKKDAHIGVSAWTQMILDSVEKDAWVLVVGDLSNLTSSVGKQLRELRKKFVIVAALREIQKGTEEYFHLFYPVRLGNLPAPEARMLIRQYTAGENLETYQQEYPIVERYVLNKSDGHPGAIQQLVEHLRRRGWNIPPEDEEFISIYPPIDLTQGLMFLGLFLIAAKYIARGFDNVLLYVLAGAGGVLLLGVRFFLPRSRR